MSDEGLTAEETEQEREQREAEERAKAQDAADEAAGTLPAAPEGTQPDGVLVVKTKDDAGGINVDAVPVGNIEPTEVLTLLELGIDAFRAKVGLRGR